MPRAKALRSDGREKLLVKLEKHAGQWIPDIDALKNFIAMSYYLSLPDRMGAVFGPHSTGYFLRDGREVTFKEVPMVKVVKEVESHIIEVVPADRRLDVHHKVLIGYRKHPAWAKESSPSRDSVAADEDGPASSAAEDVGQDLCSRSEEKPLTPFSLPRDGRTSKQLFRILNSGSMDLHLKFRDELVGLTIWRDATRGHEDGDCQPIHGETWKIRGGVVSDVITRLRMFRAAMSATS